MSISIGSRISNISTTIAVVAGAMAVPIVLVSVLPYVRTLRPPQKPRRVPDGVKRTFTTSGLELLTATPNSTNSGYAVSATASEAPLLFLHGGFGTALCYTKWMPYMAQKGRIVYSLSLRGHGQSPRPSNFVSLTAADFAQDVEEAIKHIRTLHPNLPPPVLVGHSAGGALFQYTLGHLKPKVTKGDEVDVSASGLICVAALPPMGAWRVFLNWVMHDPMLTFRTIWLGGDPKAPLYSPALVKSSFFGPKMDAGTQTQSSSVPTLMEFYEDMNPEESTGWPRSLMYPFVDVEKVKRNANGNVAWIGGECDVLVTPAITRAAAKAYNTSATIIPAAGHHLLRDIVWQDGADAILAQIRAWSL